MEFATAGKWVKQTFDSAATKKLFEVTSAADKIKSTIYTDDLAFKNSKFHVRTLTATANNRK